MLPAVSCFCCVVFCSGVLLDLSAPTFPTLVSGVRWSGVRLRRQIVCARSLAILIESTVLSFTMRREQHEVDTGHQFDFNNKDEAMKWEQTVEISAKG